MNTPLKIGYVLKRFPRLSETFILNELLALERLGVELRIYSLIDVSVEAPELPRHRLVEQLKSEVIYLPARQPLKKWRVKHGCFAGGEFAARTLKEVCGGEVAPDSILLLQTSLVSCLARAHGVTHLHAHFATDAASIAQLAHRLTGLPFSFTAHAKDIFHESVDRGLLREKIREARFVVTVSDFNRRYLLELAGGQAAKKVIRLYNGIDLERFQPDPSVHREPDLILSVGRLEPKKGFGDLIEACAALRDAQRPFRCLIVGEGPERELLARKILHLALQDRVMLAGAQPQEQLLEPLRRATVFVLPCVISETGDRDALPTALLEAMAVGLPVISTRLVGIPEIVEHGRNGMLVPPGEPKRLARAIEEVLGQPELRAALSRAGRVKVEQCFDLRKNAPLLRELFQRSATGSGQFTEAG